MPLRRRIELAALGVSVIAVAAAAMALTAGPSEHVALPYLSRHTFLSTATGFCVEATVRGTASGTRTGSVPFVHWSDVMLSDPAMTAAAYRTARGRCDHAHPVGLSAVLQQSWSTGGGASVARRTAQGPSTVVLRQFNSGSPIRLPDRGLPASAFGSDCSITGEIAIEARFGAGSEGFGYRTRITLPVTSS